MNVPPTQTASPAAAPTTATTTGSTGSPTAATAGDPDAGAAAPQGQNAVPAGSPATSAGPVPVAAAPAAATATATPAAAQADPVLSQVAGRITTVAGEDGLHRLRLRLHPEELGAVDLVVEVRGDRVRVELRAHTPAGQQALREQLGALDDQLTRDGLQPSLDLRDSGSGAPGRQLGRQPAERQEQQGPRRHPGDEPAANGDPDPPRPRHGHRLDVRG